MNLKLNLYCPILNIVMDEVVTHIYVLHLLG